jgi:hypothetical protein
VKSLVLALCLLGCRERGTITVDLDLAAGTCTDSATHVSLDLVRNGSCAECMCDECECTNDNNRSCTQACPDGLCAIADLDDGVSLDPSEPGRYMAIIKVFERSGVVANRLAIYCGEFDVMADGTENVTIAPMEVCGCP